MKNVTSSEKSEKVRASLNLGSFKGFSLADILQKTFNSITDAIFILDAEVPPRILECNKAASIIFGYEKAEMLGKTTAFLHVSDEALREFQSHLYPAAEKGRLYFHLPEYNMRRKDGSVFPSEHSVAQLLNDEGERIGWVSIVRDITERKQAEEALRNSEERYRGMVELAPDSIITVDMKGVITSVNTAFSKWTGYSKDEVVGKHFRRLGTLRARDIPKYLKLLSSALKGKIPSPFEFNYNRKDGTTACGEAHAGFLEVGGKRIGFQAILRDITERKKAEQTVRESQQKFERLFRSNPEAAVYWDSDYHILDINPRFSELFGYSLDEIKGKRTIELIVPKDEMKESEAFGEKSKEGCVYYDTLRKRKDGSLVPVSISVAPIIVEGRLIGYVGLYKGITERREMEEKLRQYSEHLEELVKKRTEELLESEKRYSVLVEGAGDGVAILQDEKLVFTNKRGAEILGYLRDELLGVPFEKLVDEKHRQHAKERYMRVLRGEKVPSPYEAEAIAKTGERIQVEVSPTLIRYQGRPADLLILRDIRERKRVEEQRLKLEKLATIGALATMVAHDLRNPLTSIINASYYIKNTCPARANAECKTALEMLDIIEKETLSTSNIINDLLDFATKRPLQKKRQNVNKLIEDSLIESNLPKNVKVERNFDKKAIATVDEKQLERVFLNLIKNAAQAMPNSGTLKISTNEAGDHVDIAFTDTGVGIPEDNMNKLFQPLFTTKAKGIGFGLAICKKIVEEHDGIIDVESKTGQGTTFAIVLPK